MIIATPLGNNKNMGGFPKLGVLFWGVPIIRILVYWYIKGTLILGNYYIYRYIYISLFIYLSGLYRGYVGL